ncbi:WD40-repeat-containing domain protein [Blastocladiella britannica]|nr:WD40-repeat-containing domain protein [Blastocladiella britannica]
MAMSSSGTSRPASRLTATRPPSVVMHSQVDLTDEFVPIPLLVELRPNSGTPIVAVAGSVGMGEFEPKSTSGRGASRKGNQAPTPSDGTTRPASRALNFANRQSGPDQDLGAESHRRDDSDDDYDENQPIEGDMGPEGNLESTFMPPGERLDSASSHPSSAGTAAFAVGGGGTTKKKPGAPPGSGGAAAAGAASVAAPPSLVLPITIPHGFQLQRSLLHGKAAVRSVLFTASLALETKSPTSTTMVSHAPTPATGHNAPSAYSAVNAFSNPNADTFASLDAHFVHLWRGTSRVRKRGLGPSIDLTREAREPIAAGGGGLGGLTEPVAQWCYIRKHRLYVVATDRLELKILDHNLLELSRRASEKAVLTLEVIEDEIIVGCVGGVWIYPIHREPESVANHSVYVLLNPRLVLRNLGEDEWVGKIMFRASMRRLYVACDVTINIFDYDSGERVDSLTNLHELAITALTIHEPTELLITGCKDGSIKVWNSQRLLLMAFHDHAGAISSLLLPLSLSSLQRPPPILLSGSLDGSLRMWDLDKGRCVYRQPTQQRVLGMGMMRRDVFFHYSPRAIYVWHLNRLISSFTGTQSPITHIMRVMAPAPVLRPSSSPGGTTLSPTKRGEMGRRARLVIACEDGSVRLVSPRTGQVLATCFPTFKQISILDIAHDILQERAYTLMSSGEIISFDTSVNPARVVATLDGRAAGSDMGRLTCMVALSEPQPLENTFTVLGGTSVGQIVQVDLASGRHSMLVQGHTATVISIQALPAQTADGCAWVVTCALDRSVKTWKWYPEGALEPVHAITCTGVPRRLKGAPPVTLKGIDAASGSMSVNVAWPTVYMLASSQGPLSVHETLPTGALSGLAGKSLLQGSPSASHSSLPNLASVVVPGPHAPGRVWLHSPDEDHTSSVTAVDFLPALGMFLTSGTDGVVKVWSVENTLLREIQVGEPVTSVAFANARGDLLIGVHDEVSVVRWRDYMPASMCNIMQDLVLPEDPLEDPMPFDSGLDFWNGFHGQPGFDNSQWQLCM